MGVSAQLSSADPKGTAARLKRVSILSRWGAILGSALATSHGDSALATSHGDSALATSQGDFANSNSCVL